MASTLSISIYCCFGCVAARSATANWTVLLDTWKK